MSASPHDWTGETACALQSALRLTNEGFAKYLGVHVRTIATWHEQPERTPRAEIQEALDTALDKASAQARDRFVQLSRATPATAASTSPSIAVNELDERLTSDPNIVAALDWLDQHADHTPGTSATTVTTELATLNLHALRERGRRRANAKQRDLADALSAYYGARQAPYGLYAARSGGTEVSTSVLTQPRWIDLHCPLSTVADAFTVNSSKDTFVTPLSDHAAAAAARRIAEVVATGARLVDKPLYRLNTTDIAAGVLRGSFSVERFTRYALTADLLESELTDAVASEASPHAHTLSLRDELLPDLASVLNVSNRMCAGGALALVALARPATSRRAADYLLLIQERSGNVINAARRLAVIPKGFHQPITDYAADTQVGATLLRELEEELFERADIDNTIGADRSADPMHPSRLSEQLSWLLQNSAMTMECTGFGLNLISGNYEFASLIVVDNDEFWTRYGGQLAANWETEGLRQVSSLDHTHLQEIISDVAWSNEGLFALLQGLRRLEQIDRQRVTLPTIEWELQ